MKKQFHDELLAFLREHRNVYVGYAKAMVEQNPEQGEGKFSEADLGQMVDGFLAVIAEGLAGDLSGPVRTMYLETVIPALVEAGTTPSALVRTVASWSAQVAYHLGEHAPASLRASGAPEWLGFYLGDWVAAMMTSAST